MIRNIVKNIVAVLIGAVIIGVVLLFAWACVLFPAIWVIPLLTFCGWVIGTYVLDIIKIFRED